MDRIFHRRGHRPGPESVGFAANQAGTFWSNAAINPSPTVTRTGQALSSHQYSILKWNCLPSAWSFAAASSIRLIFAF